MGKQLSELDDLLVKFIENQKMFFVGTAGIDGRVNISPKGMDSLRILNSKKLVWLNFTGSGNETAAHVLECNRMTLLFCAFEGVPNIVRLYGKVRTFHPRDIQWNDYIGLFPTLPGARQLFLLDIESVVTSCGFSVPRFDFVEERNTLVEWAEKKGPEGVAQYWREKNVKSIDGKPTHVLGD